MKKIAFITSEEDPLLIADDQLAIAPLRELGYFVEPVIWDGDQGHLNSFDAFIFRSCWNCHRKHDQFVEWLTNLNKLDVPILNNLDINLWNINKKYLLDLAQKGVRIPRTKWLSKDTVLNSETLTLILKEIDSKKVVIKPAISLNGHDTYLESSDDIKQIEIILKSLPQDHDILIQEFIPEIKTSG